MSRVWFWVRARFRDRVKAIYRAMISVMSRSKVRVGVLFQLRFKLRSRTGAWFTIRVKVIFMGKGGCNGSSRFRFKIRFRVKVRTWPMAGVRVRFLVRQRGRVKFMRSISLRVRFRFRITV